MTEPPAEVREAVRAHIAAVNDGDLEALVDGFDEDVVFASGDDLIVGRRALRELLAASLARLAPRLEARTMVVDGDTAACELAERVHPTEGGAHELDLAAFFTVRRAHRARQGCTATPPTRCRPHAADPASTPPPLPTRDV